jgi:hypothetical protein
METPGMNQPAAVRHGGWLPNRSQIVAACKETPRMNESAKTTAASRLPERCFRVICVMAGVRGSMVNVTGPTWRTISIETIFDVFGIEYKWRLVEWCTITRWLNIAGMTKYRQK